MLILHFKEIFFLYVLLLYLQAASENVIIILNDLIDVVICIWCYAQIIFKWIKIVDLKRVKMLKNILKSIDRFWNRFTVDQIDKLYFFVVIVFIQNRSFFVWENLFEANAISIYITFIFFFVWHLLFKFEISSFKSTFIQKDFYSCDHFYSKWKFFRVTIFILNSTRIIVDKSCFIYREYDLSELFVEIDLRFLICFERKKSL